MVSYFVGLFGVLENKSNRETQELVLVTHKFLCREVHSGTGRDGNKQGESSAY